jgi:hypothetical protein
MMNRTDPDYMVFIMISYYTIPEPNTRDVNDYDVPIVDPIPETTNIHRTHVHDGVRQHSRAT